MSKFFNALAVAVLGIAMLMGAASADHDATFTGNPVDGFEISAAPTGTALTLAVTGTNPATYSANLIVNANSAWTVTAIADAGTGHTRGYMSKYTAGSTNAYATSEVKLANPMYIDSPDISSTSLAVASSPYTVAVASGSSSETNQIDFSQTVTWDDKRLTGADETYRMVVTFAIS